MFLIIHSRLSTDYNDYSDKVIIEPTWSKYLGVLYGLWEVSKGTHLVLGYIGPPLVSGMSGLCDMGMLRFKINKSC